MMSICGDPLQEKAILLDGINLKPSDFILGYSRGKFYYIGQVFDKTHNRQLGTEVWGGRDVGICILH